MHSFDESPVPKEHSPRPTRSQVRLANEQRIPSQEQMWQLYRWSKLSRALDDLEIQLKRQNHIYFQISGAGHEVSLVAAAMHLRPGYDWFFPYYRDRALVLALGVSAKDMLLQSVGAEACPASGGRQMPNHWSCRTRHIVSEASTTGTQYLSAVGCAEAGRYRRRKLTDAGSADATPHDEVVYVSSGEGATSQGVFFEALGSASLARLPIVFHIEDNGWAISTPAEQQTPGGSISELVRSYPDLKIIEFDGCDALESFAAWGEGVAHARSGMGPVLLHAHVVRPYSHSLSDDDKFYRTQEDLAEQERRDPLPKLRAQLLEGDASAPARMAELENELIATLEAAREAALGAAPPSGQSALRYVFSEDVDPTSTAFDCPRASAGETLTVVDGINTCLRQEMARDARVLVFGEDVADAPDDATLAHVRGKGGVFKVTHGLQRIFGQERVFNTPLAEANIVGRAFGMALRGLKPVVEIQFFDYIWPAMMQIRSEVALLRWRSNNAWSCPMVIRAAYGGYLRGGSIFHSQSGESIFAHIPGLRVVMPSNAADAAGLLRTAIRSDDPVLFLEHKHLYRQPYNRSGEIDGEHLVPFGQAHIVQPGEHITLVTYGATVKRSLDAVKLVAADGLSVELIDLRSLSPYDWHSIAQSVQRTNRVLIVHEETRSWGFGSEIAARIADELFLHLDAPVRRVAAQDTFVGYHPDLETFILPQTEDIATALRELAAF